MPHRRRVKKGSFGGHFDELVKHFNEKPSQSPEKDEDASKDERNVHDKLFESAWRHDDKRAHP